MTIAAAYLTSEGVVLGADSTTTVSSGNSVSQLLNHAQKVFEIGEDSRIGACTYGAGMLGESSHRTIFGHLGDWLDGHTVQEVATKLVDLVEVATNGRKQLSSDVGYFVGGWDLADRKPGCFHVKIRPKQKTDIRKMSCGEASFSGQPVIFNRVFRGYDPALPKELFTDLSDQLKPYFSDEFTPDAFRERFEESFKKISSKFEVSGYRDLPIREAIDYVHAYLHVTIKAFKFRSGPPPCGGPIEIGFVTTDRKFRWANHKGFETAVMDHAPSSRRM